MQGLHFLHWKDSKPLSSLPAAKAAIIYHLYTLAYVVPRFIWSPHDGKITTTAVFLQGGRIEKSTDDRQDLFHIDTLTAEQ